MIHRLVWAIYDRDVTDPSRWLAELVANNAAALGLAQKKRRRFEWDAARASQIKKEREILTALSQRLFELHPNFSLTLDEQIKKGIRSRKEESGC